MRKNRWKDGNSLERKSEPVKPMFIQTEGDPSKRNTRTNSFKSTYKSGYKCFLALMVFFYASFVRTVSADLTCIMAPSTIYTGVQQSSTVIFSETTLSSDQEFQLRIPVGYGFEDVNSVDNNPVTCSDLHGGTTLICQGFIENSYYVISMNDYVVSEDFAQLRITINAPLWSSKIEAQRIDCSLVDPITGELTTTHLINPFTINASENTNTLTLIGSPSTTSASSTVTLSIEMSTDVPASSYFILVMPKYNTNYQNAGTPTAVSLISDASSLSGSWSTGSASGTLSSGNFAFTQDTDFSSDYLQIELQNSDTISSGETLEINVDQFTMPPSLQTISGFTATITIAELVAANSYIKVVQNITTEATLTCDAVYSNTAGSLTVIGENDSIGALNAEYLFSMTHKNPIPKGAEIRINIPLSDMIPNGSVSGFTATCTSGCSISSTASFSWADPVLTVNNMFSSYVESGQALTFSIKGWTNPTSTDTLDLSLTTSWTSSGGQSYDIEEISGFEVSVVEGECQISTIYVTDSDFRIWAEPQNYTFKMTCNHDFQSDYSIKITMPSQFTLVDRYRCIFAGYKTRYSCVVDATSNEIEISGFLDSTIEAQNEIVFTVDSIRNPKIWGPVDAITVQTLDSGGSQVDVGTFLFDEEYWSSGNFTTFEVEPLDNGVGQFPVQYRFHVVPIGDICQNCYFSIQIPDEIEISDRDALEAKCGDDLQDFVEETIDCDLSTDGRTLLIKNGFTTAGTTNLTDSDNSNDPPDIYFTIDYFRNPRQNVATGPWNITLYNKSADLQFSWNQTTYPTTKVTGVASPYLIQVDRGSDQNGAISDWTFTVQTTNYIKTGDTIYITLPYTMSFSEDSICQSLSDNLYGNLNCKVSVTLTKILIEVRLSEWTERYSAARTLQYTGRIDPGDAFRFVITSVKNAISFRTPESLMYQVFDSKNVLFEEKTKDFFVINTKPGNLSEYKSGLTPTSFEAGVYTNYTLEIWPTNYEKNLFILVYLPKAKNESEAILLPSENDTFSCYGLAGTDVASADNQTLKCTLDRKNNVINITNAVAYQRGNPGQLRILFSQLKNPIDNIVTESFKIETYTPDGWLLDSIDQNVTINFYCQFPCASCLQETPEICQACYPSAIERFFYQDQCMSICPDGFVNTTTNNCTECNEPCATCTGTPDTCLSCMEGYKLVDGEYRCREIVLWPFPYIIFGFASFVVILVSEIRTKGESRFKEAFIAALALPEFLSWINLLIFMWARVGSSGSTALCMIAILLYVMINIAHAIIHPRQMYPNALPTYKELYVNFPCSTFLVRMLSYVFSFKFSLILVSWFCLDPKFKGDYSAMNWKYFNRLSIAFIILCYPIIMICCIWFLYYNGMFSYAGFLAIEVVILTSLLVLLMFLDAISAIKCKTVGKAKTSRVFKVATGADYESDDDIVMKQSMRKAGEKKRVHRVSGATPGDDPEQFGANDDDSDFDDSKRALAPKGKLNDDELERMSRLSHETGVLRTDEARKQIQMLEELAKQMRLEKQMIEKEKRLLEEQRRELENQREAQEYRLDAYTHDQQRQTSALSEQVKELERQKHDLVHRVEERLAAGAGATDALLKQIETETAGRKQRRNFRDFEGEMEDYEPVAEENSNDEDDSGECVDPYVDRMEGKPAFGEIDYYRQMEGDDQHWMQQITPRAGGDSMLGQHDQHDEGQQMMDKNNTAQYDDDISVPPTRHERQVNVGQEDPVYKEESLELNAQRSEFFANRSDAEMEVISDHQNFTTEQEFMERERAVFSRCKTANTAEQATEQFNQILQPVFEHMEPISDRHAIEQKCINLISPAMGEADQISDLHGDPQHYFHQEKPTFEAVQKDDENNLIKQATTEKFFNQEKAFRGEMDDLNREGVATPIDAFNQESAAFSQIPDMENRSAIDQRLFNNKTPIKDDVSDFRDKNASEFMFNNKPGALASQADGEQRGKSSSQIGYFQNEDGKYSQDKSMINKTDFPQEYFKNDDGLREDVTSQNKSANISQEMFLNKSGLNGQNRAVSEIGHGGYGLMSDYGRQREQNQEFAGTPEKDESGVSQSSEGSIANHGLFNAAADPKQQQRKSRPDASKINRAVSPHFHEDTHDQHAQQIPKKGGQKRQILYSDKSETSVEELMEDTPSNYNIQNGRFEGKSLGLKALLLHAKKANTLDTINERDRSPQASRTSRPNNIISSGMAAAQRGIIGSQNDERNFINSLYTGQKNDLDGRDGGSNFGGKRNPKTQVRKNFKEKKNSRNN